jgi:predicted DNA-binding transcriptional regulator YafY
MYNPTTRLLTILELLQVYPRLSGSELARRWRSIPQRPTLCGDAQDLGIPIEAERGPLGGYRLRPGYKLPPLLFTDEEAVALTLALVAAPRLGIAADGAAVAGALAKIERVLPEAPRTRVRALQSTVTMDVGPAPAAVESSLVATVGEAAAQGRRVWMRYRSGTDAETTREVDPYGVVAWGRSWYVVGHCHLRKDLRTFRLDRVLELAPREAMFDPPLDFDLRGHLMRSIARMHVGPEIVVDLAAPLEQVRSRIWEEFAALEVVPSGTRLTCHYDDLDGFGRYLVGLGWPFTVVRPVELKASLRRLASEVSAAAERVA